MGRHEGAETIVFYSSDSLLYVRQLSHQSRLHLINISCWCIRPHPVSVWPLLIDTAHAEWQAARMQQYLVCKPPPATPPLSSADPLPV